MEIKSKKRKIKCLGYAAKILFMLFFFFKQKTAYEIVSRDWSSDVCSSDLYCTIPSLGIVQYERVDIDSAPSMTIMWIMFVQFCWYFEKPKK